MQFFMYFRMELISNLKNQYYSHFFGFIQIMIFFFKIFTFFQNWMDVRKFWTPKNEKNIQSAPKIEKFSYIQFLRGKFDEKSEGCGFGNAENGTRSCPYANKCGNRSAWMFERFENAETRNETGTGSGTYFDERATAFLSFSRTESLVACYVCARVFMFVSWYVHIRNSIILNFRWVYSVRVFRDSRRRHRRRGALKSRSFKKLTL